jgi:uncharacterized peroxidase-related enzyme
MRLTWVDHIEDEDATGELAEFYAEGKKWEWADGRVPAIYKVLSLRPKIAVAKEELRLAVFGGEEEPTIGHRRSEMINLVVSGLNNCRFCASAHAGALLRREHATLPEAVQLFTNWRAVELSEQDQAMLEYCEKLSFDPSRMTEADIEELRRVGFSDENIVDIVAHVAYRHWINRVHDALGVDLTQMDIYDQVVPFVEAIGGPKAGTTFSAGPES